MRAKIEAVFKSVFLFENEGAKAPRLTDDVVLLETGLDSLGFATFVMELEAELGFDPFSLSEEPYYPRTFGELVTYYVDNEPK